MQIHKWLLAALLLGVLIAPTCVIAGTMSVKIQYAGYGFNTSVDTNDDGQPVSLSVATGKGTFGNSSISITVEFEYPDGGDNPCDSDYAWLPVVAEDGHYWAAVLTAPDHSQVFSLFDQGYLCVRLTPPYDYYGVASGFYAGGSGRYEGAYGDWAGEFEGVNLDATVGFRSIKGSIWGEISLP